MFTTIIVLHVITAIILVLAVLIQTGRGAELGAAFGSMGQASFGRGQQTFLAKATTVLAVVFMVTSMSLSLLSSKLTGRSVIQASGDATPVSSGPVQLPTEPLPLQQSAAGVPGAVPQSGTTQPAAPVPASGRQLEQTPAP